MKATVKIMKFYGFCKTVLGALIRLIFNIKIINPENEPLDRPYLVCSNHISLWDPVMLAALLKQQIHFMAKSELFAVPFLKGLITKLGAFPVVRGSFDVGSVKTAINLLGDGKCVGMFPQGTRHTGEEPNGTEVKGGVGMVLMRAQTTVLPVSIVTKGDRLRFTRKMYFIIGKPIEYSEFTAKEKCRDEFTRITAQIFKEICVLHDEHQYLFLSKSERKAYEEKREKSE